MGVGERLAPAIASPVPRWEFKVTTNDVRDHFALHVDDLEHNTARR